MLRLIHHNYMEFYETMRLKRINRAASTGKNQFNSNCVSVRIKNSSILTFNKAKLKRVEIDLTVMAKVMFVFNAHFRFAVQIESSNLIMVSKTMQLIDI